jgi:hypothetical protein
MDASKKYYFRSGIKIRQIQENDLKNFSVVFGNETSAGTISNNYLVHLMFLLKSKLHIVLDNNKAFITCRTFKIFKTLSKS